MYREMYFHASDRFPHQPVSLIWKFMYIFSAFCLFTKLNRMMRLHKTETKDQKTNWLRRNVFLSCLHALICSILIIIAVFRAPEIFEDPLSHSNDFNCALIAFSLGYFIYDFIDCLQNYTPSTFIILIHHIVVITFLTQVLYHTRNIGYTIYGLSVEFNSVFLHGRRLIRWYNPITTSRYYNNLLKISVEIGNYITLIVFRFGVVFVGLHALYTERNRLHPIVHLFSVMVGIGITMLNTVLFYRLTKNQFLGKPKGNEEKILMTDNHVLSPNENPKNQ